MPDRLTPEQIQKIEARFTSAMHGEYRHQLAIAVKDIPALLAEIKALRTVMGAAAKAIIQYNPTEAYHQLYVGLVGDLSLPAEEQSRMMRNAMEMECLTD